MPLSRRHFLKHSSAVTAWTLALQGTPSHSQQQFHAEAAGETDSISFWNQFFTSTKSNGSTERGGTAKASIAAPGTQVEYVHLGPNGLRYVEDIKPEELAPLNGDVMLSVSPAQFRFGGNGKPENFLHSAQLRFDIHQSQRFLNVLPYLAWTSLAAIFPERSGRLPSIQQLNFTTSSTENAVDKILLPGGMGTIAVNLSTARKTSALYSVLQGIARETKSISPVLGLPAISLVALQAFTSLYAQIEQRTTFLLSGGPASIAVTQEAWESDDRPAQAMPFPPGDYLLFPKEHADFVRPEFDRLTIENGYVVRTDADKKLPVVERALQAVKGATYVTMHMSVSQVKLSSADTPKEGANAPEGAAPKSEKKRKPR